jgi:hypothetical protein
MAAPGSPISHSVSSIPSKKSARLAPSQVTVSRPSEHGFAYDWDLVETGSVVATGRLYSDKPIEVGDSVETGEGQAEVVEVLPRSRYLDGRLILEIRAA